MAAIITFMFQVIFSMLLPQLQNANAHDLIVYGEDFKFSVKEPEHLIGDIDNAEMYSANIIFYKAGHDLKDPSGIIRVRVNNKQDENTAEDLAYDMEGYKKEFPNVEFADIKVFHRSYKCYPKLFFVKGDFYEYVTYINPGKKKKYTFSVAMSTQKVQATDEELAAYAKVIASITSL